MDTGTSGEQPQDRAASPRTTARLSDVDRREGPPPRIDTDSRAAVQALPPGSALLIVHHGPAAGARFLLETERATAGRDTGSDIFLDDITVSRRHCEFLNTSGAITVRDVGSLNGTYVNRTRVDASDLHAGDEVQIGKFRFIFHPSPHQANADPAAQI